MLAILTFRFYDEGLRLDESADQEFPDGAMVRCRNPTYDQIDVPMRTSVSYEIESDCGRHASLWYMAIDNVLYPYPDFVSRDTSSKTDIRHFTASSRVNITALYRTRRGEFSISSNPEQEEDLVTHDGGVRYALQADSNFSQQVDFVREFTLEFFGTWWYGGVPKLQRRFGVVVGNESDFRRLRREAFGRFGIFAGMRLDVFNKLFRQTRRQTVYLLSSPKGRFRIARPQRLRTLEKWKKGDLDGGMARSMFPKPPRVFVYKPFAIMAVATILITFASLVPPIVECARKTPREN